jgi:serine/threonine protein kinase
MCVEVASVRWVPDPKHILRPGDRFLPVTLGTATWWITYGSESGVLWEFDASDGLETRHIYVERETGGGPWNKEVPAEVLSCLRTALAPSFQPINASARSILELMADRLAHEATPTGRWLRKELGLSREQTDAAFTALTPLYVEAESDGPHRDFYSLRMPGVLLTKKRDEFTSFVQQALAHLAGQFEANANVDAYHWADLSQEVDVKDEELAGHYLALARLGTKPNSMSRLTSSVAAMMGGWLVPDDIEELSKVRKFSDFLSYIRRGSRSDLSPTAPVIFKQGQAVPTAHEAIVPVGHPPAQAPKTPAKKRTYETAFRTYVRVKQLGEGGNGVVELVRDGDNREYALKRLRTMTSTEKQKRFVNEISVAHNLRHRNIVRVLDHGFRLDGDDPEVFYVMPLYPKVLRACIGQLQPAEALRIAHGLAEALVYAHSQGVWHRDLKPENVALDKNDSPVLLDFGIAHMTDELMMTHVETKENAKMGNFMYAAPEQRGRMTCDHRADIYTFGMMLNELFTGRVAEGNGYSLIADVSPVHANLDELVEAMMQYKPDKRPSAQEVVEELVRCGASAIDDPKVSLPPSGERSLTSRRHADFGVSMFLLFEAEGSSRRYAAKWLYTTSNPDLNEGARYKLPGLDRDFVVRVVRRTEAGAELWSEPLTLPDADSLPDIDLREQLRNSGWKILEGSEIDDPE